ncbi:MAG: hypothetical protein KGI06_00110 [Candidatus Micrarchaeota archaeon]|nr:hypothetical protein [Candidatus Micrarchaeota archaeon]
MVPSALLVSYATGPTGVENITLSSHSVKLSPGGNAIVSYSLNYVSGYYLYGTELYVVGYNQLGSENITVLITNKSGNPPIKGTMYIFLSHALQPGTYNITLAGNSSGTKVNPDTLILTVLSPYNTTTRSTVSAPTSTIYGSTGPSTQATTAPPGSSTPKSTVYATQGSQSQNNTMYYALAIVAIIILIAIIFAFGRMRRKEEEKPKKQQNAQQPNA